MRPMAKHDTKDRFYLFTLFPARVVELLAILFLVLPAPIIGWYNHPAYPLALCRLGIPW
jgi:hypothetical protein